MASAEEKIDGFSDRSSLLYEARSQVASSQYNMQFGKQSRPGV
jgi:hypothetical protein